MDGESLRRFATDWFALLDRHAQLDEFKPYLSNTDLTMVFPEGISTGLEGFRAWYERVAGLFFDERHTLQEMSPDPPSEDGSVQVRVVVRWEASVWHPPKPQSERISTTAYQTWKLAPSPKDPKTPEIRRYVVDRIEYDEGSARL
jgi:hypothetical protein